MTGSSVANLMQGIGRGARAAAAILALATTAAEESRAAAAAAALRAHLPKILAANAADMRDAAASAALSAALLDRLLLDDQRIEAMARGLEDIERLADPIGRRLTEWSRPNGLRIERVCVPLGRDRHHLREPPQRDRGRRRHCA